MGVALLVYVVLSWLVPRDANPYAGIIDAMVAPWLRPIRRYVPLVGGFDLSPLVAGVLLQIAYLVLIYAQSLVVSFVP